jgi:hypothetical protein
MDLDAALLEPSSKRAGAPAVRVGEMPRHAKGDAHRPAIGADAEQVEGAFKDAPRR